MKHKNFLSRIKPGKKILRFGDIEIKQDQFYQCKSRIFSEDIDIKYVLLSNKISSGEKSYKYFIGYFCDDYNVKTLHTILPKMSI